MFLSGCTATVSQDSWNHFAFSAAISSTGTAAGADPGAAVAVAACLGLLKEVHDGLWGSGFSTGDLFWDLAGSVTGSSAAYAIKILEDNP